MPILDVEFVGEPLPELRTGLAQRLADACGQVLASPPKSTWVRLRVLDVNDYAENLAAPRTAAPIFLRVLLRELPESKARARLARELAQVIAALCARPIERVHVLFEAAAEGRIAFGGEMD